MSTSRSPADADTIPTSDVLLEVRNLATQFRTPAGTVHAVAGVSFSLAAGETLGIVGESGSGKSVLARTIMQLTPHYAEVTGDVIFNGVDLRQVQRKHLRTTWGNDISIVFQDPMTSLNPVVRIGRQITEGLELHLGLDSRAAHDRAVALLSQVGIPEPERRLQNFPHELSGGMRQRVCIAIVIVCAPKLLFADEPTTALDVTIQRQILDLLTSLQRQHGMATVLITHDLGVVAGRTDRTMVMYGGRIMETSDTRTLFHKMRHPYTEALLASIPRLERPSHSRLAVIAGRPADALGDTIGCRFAPRCRHAQPRCLIETPGLEAGLEYGHEFACFYPVGTPRGREALEANIAAGHTAAGLPISSADYAVSRI